MTQIHGGDLDMAMHRFGGAADEWIDLSTGINRIPYPLPAIPSAAWSNLPTLAAIEALNNAARHAYATDAAVVPLPGAQAAIQMLPHLFAPTTVRILAPTYGEYAPAFQACGWRVEIADTLEKLPGADIAVVANPNNPDGRAHAACALRRLAEHVGTLIVDESFADAAPELSLATGGIAGNVIVLRSFGKFYGLAGLRLGFALATPALAKRIATFAGPWPVSGPAIAIGRAALQDDAWRKATIDRLKADARRIDALASHLGWKCEGGTALFRLFRTDNAELAKVRLARARIWSRTFHGAPHWLRLGIPGPEHEWRRLEAALQTASAGSVAK